MKFSAAPATNLFWLGVVVGLRLPSLCWSSSGSAQEGITMKKDENTEVTMINAGSSDEKLVLPKQHVRGRKAQQASYNCKEGCDLSRGDFVCGDNGVTYSNECLAVCQKVAVAKNGMCSPVNDDEGGRGGGGGIVGLESSFVMEGTVSRRTMRLYKGEGFNFVGRGKLLENAGPAMMSPEFDAGRTGTPPSPMDARALRVTAGGDVYVAVRDAAEGSGAAFAPPLPATTVSTNDDGDVGEEKGGRHNRRELNVIGVDDRVREYRSEPPGSRIGMVEFATSEGDSVCTGTVISRTTVITAAHCVYDNQLGGFYQIRGISPGRLRGSDNPWGYWRYDSAILYVAYAEGVLGYDIAVIRLQPQNGGFIGDFVGAMGLKQTSGVDSKVQTSTITGYPGDKSFTKWTSSCPGTYEPDTISPNPDGFDVVHKCDTFGGVSGAALLDEDNFVRGVHFAAYRNQPYNIATLLNGQRFYDILEWSDRWPVGHIRQVPEPHGCLDYNAQTGRVFLSTCRNNHRWRIDSTANTITANDGNDCVDFAKTGDYLVLSLRQCIPSTASQKWAYDRGGRIWTSLHPDKLGWYVTWDPAFNRLTLERFFSTSTRQNQWFFPHPEGL